MKQALTIDVDNEPIRFTPNGKVSAVDATRAVTNSSHPWGIWKRLKGEHPEILIYCEDYSFQGEGSSAVVDSEDWERISMLLPTYLYDPPLSGTGDY